VIISRIPFMVAAPSPTKQITGRSGKASLAATA
jgi:hypothetical protein